MGFFATLGAKLTLDGSGFKAGIREAEAHSKRFATETLGNLKGQLAAAFGAGAVIAFTKALFDHATSIKHISQQWDISTDQVQLWGKAARRVGLDIESLMPKLEKFAELRRKAKEDPEGSEAKLLHKMGISDDQINDPMKQSLDLIRDIKTDSRDLWDEAFGTKAGQKVRAFLEELKKSKGMAPGMLSQDEVETMHEQKLKADEAMLRIKGAGVRAVAALATDGKWTDPLKLFFTLGFGKFRPNIETEDRHQDNALPLTASPKAQKAEAEKERRERAILQDVQNQMAIEEYQYQLAQKITSEEYRRMTASEKINKLKADNLGIDTEIARLNALQSASAYDEIIRQSNLASMKEQRLANESALYDLDHKAGGSGIDVDSYQKRGMQVAGAGYRSSYYGSVGTNAAEATKDNTTRIARFTEQQVQLMQQHLDFIRRNPTVNFN